MRTKLLLGAVAVAIILALQACGPSREARTTINGRIEVGDHWAWGRLNQDGTTAPCTQINSKSTMICAGDCYKVVPLGDEVTVVQIPCPEEVSP